MLFFFSHVVFGQLKPANPGQGSMKAKGQIAIPQQVHPVEPIPAIVSSGHRVNSGGPKSPANGGLFVPLDGTFTQVYFTHDPLATPGYSCDDGYTDAIALPFTFCFYGTNESQFYINNNGNVSFNGGYYDFTSTGFPVNGYPMLAPFWADVDTRAVAAPNGEVWYKIEPHHVIVIWNNVGYYQMQGDKRNTFELIFTDGTDPIIGVGNNVAFSYSAMQWTTGSASGGVGGFGGTPATVGVNKGDGVKYALVGRFDHAGTDYDGAGGANDGVGYLEGQYYTFNACLENVIIPPNNVPTLSQWGLIILGGVLLVFGTMVILRWKGTSA
jgi:hypothetical protein